MAIIKAISKVSKTNIGMKNDIKYIMDPKKTVFQETPPNGITFKATLISLDGFFAIDDESNYLEVYNSFMEEKRIWNKTDGRLYYHNVISFPPNGEVDPFDVMRIAQDFTYKFFNGYQSVIAVHIDTKHLHAHIITNSVSYIDGKKYNFSKRTLWDMKSYITEVCKEEGLTIEEKGKHYDGTAVEPFEIRAYDRNKWFLLHNKPENSYLVDCAHAIENAKTQATNKDDFIEYMLKLGWRVDWTDDIKYITFENSDNKKVSSDNISKTFNINVSKEALINDFQKNNCNT